MVLSIHRCKVLGLPTTYPLWTPLTSTAFLLDPDILCFWPVTCSLLMATYFCFPFVLSSLTYANGTFWIVPNNSTVPQRLERPTHTDAKLTMLYDFLRISVHWPCYILLLKYDVDGDSHAFKKFAWTKGMDQPGMYFLADEQSTHNECGPLQRSISNTNFSNDFQQAAAKMLTK